MDSIGELDTTTLALLVLGGLVLLPLLTMGFGGMWGFGGRMGGYGATGWMWPFGMLFPLVLFLALLGGGYLLIQRVSE